MTVKQYAAHRRCSRAAIYKALGGGRIVREPDGSIDPIKADRTWAHNTLPTMRWPADGGIDSRSMSDAELDRLVDRLLG
jgi:hypothetical protein